MILMVTSKWYIKAYFVMDLLFPQYHSFMMEIYLLCSFLKGPVCVQRFPFNMKEKLFKFGCHYNWSLLLILLTFKSLKCPPQNVPLDMIEHRKKDYNSTIMKFSCVLSTVCEKLFCTMFRHVPLSLIFMRLKNSCDISIVIICLNEILTIVFPILF